MGGNYAETGGSLLFSTSKLEHELVMGQAYQGMFEIEEESGRNMEGYIYSSSIRVTPMVDAFNGTLAQIPYEVNTEGMQSGDVLKGNFSIISNRGEYILPFVVSIVHSTIGSSLGPIKNLFHFTNLCKSDWNEAVAVYNDPNFIGILHGNDAKYRNLYMGLSGRGSRNHNLEEFLVGIGKKQTIQYSLNKDSLKLANPQGLVAETVDIERNGWGYTLMAVKACGDFIELSTNRLTDEDFSGDVCHYEFGINESGLHAGRNYGSITFRHIYGSLTLEVCVTDTGLGRSSLESRKYKSTTFALMRHYLDYKMGRIVKNKWVQLTEELLSHRDNIDVDELENNLYKTHMLLIAERYNEAKWILDRQVTGIIDEADNELYCYYLYLMTLYNVDEYYAREATSRIKSIYDKDRSNWRIGLILVMVSEDLKRVPSRLYSFGLKLIDGGCHSPLLYIELVNLLNESPTLLMHMEASERRVILFAARNGLIGEELSRQVAYQAGRLKEFDTRVYKTLEVLYEMYESSYILEAICLQLMRGDKRGRSYVDWYTLGAEANLPITGLMESYMASLDLMNDSPLPKAVLMYFSYQNNLPDDQAAYLYAYVVRNRDRISELYVHYNDDVNRFVLRQLYAGNISRDLAYLYSELVLKEMATADNLRQFATVMLKHCVRIDDPSIASVVVIDERMKEELTYPVSRGVACVTLPSTDYTVLLEDVKGNRYYQTKEYITEMYFLPRKLLPQVEAYAEDSLLLDLFICDGNKDFLTLTDRNVSRYRYLEQCNQVSEEYRSALRLPLVRFYQDRDDGENLDQILNTLGRDDVPYKDRDELLRILISRGHIDRAYNYLVYYGPENIDPQIIVRVVALLLERDGYVDDEAMRAVAWNAFTRGKYNDTTLTYLARYYRGSIKNMRNIWRAASGFYVDTYNICEKMLQQTLLTGAYIGDEVAVFREYVEGGAKLDLELEYLQELSEEHFSKDRVVDGYMFSEVERLYDNGEKLPDVCLLAFLKYHAENGRVQDLPEPVKSHIRRFIHILYSDKGIIMPYMKEFKDISVEACEMSNLSMVEYRGEPKSRVTINYCLNRDGDKGRGYIREEMHQVMGGVYVKPFLLFFGENLQYYITENADGMEQLTMSGTLNCNNVENDNGTDRYSLVNDIALSTTLKDYDTALTLLEEYKYKEYLVDNIFTIQ